jgi:hypothetical protein
MKCTDCIRIKIKTCECVLKCPWIIMESATTEGANEKCKFFIQGQSTY